VNLRTSSKPFGDHGLFLQTCLHVGDGVHKNRGSSYDGVHDGRIQELFWNFDTIGGCGANLQLRA